MAHDGISKIQHYVPQFLLRNFGMGKKHRLHVFDKQAEKTFSTNCKNVAAESRFYDFELEGTGLTIEPSLSRVETMAKPLIKSILEADSLAGLTTENRAEISIFLAVQFTRTKWYREQFRELPRRLEEALRRKLGQDADLSSISDYFAIPDDNELTVQAAHSIMSGAAAYSTHFADKIWVLGATDAKHPFLISDNPVGLQNMTDAGPRGNSGLAVRGIEIYFPLSPRRLLAMWCPSFEQVFRDAVGRRGPESDARQVLIAVETGSPLPFLPEHVLNVNAIQVRHAERFVFSNVDDFSLVKEMIATHDSFRTGPRSVIN